MAKKALQPVAPLSRPSAAQSVAPDTQPSAPAASRDPDMLKRLAAEADPSQPPAVMPEQGGRTIAVNFRFSERLADAVADAAASQGTSQKVIVTRALRDAGIAVPAEDLEDRTRRRRRGAGNSGRR